MGLALAVAILGGGRAIASLVVGPDSGPSLAGATAVSTEASRREPQGDRCSSSGLNSDLNRDGAPDTIFVFAVHAAGGTCAALVPSEEHTSPGWHVGVVLDLGLPTQRIRIQPLPECSTGCAVLSTPDVNGDGLPEALLRLTDHPADTFGLYVVRWYVVDGLSALGRLEINGRGDPWHQEFGFRPGPPRFRMGGSANHIHELRCEGAPGDLVLVAATAMPLDIAARNVYRLHETMFSLDWDQLVVVSSRDSRIRIGDPAFPEPTAETVCGSPVIRPD